MNQTTGSKEFPPDSQIGEESAKKQRAGGEKRGKAKDRRARKHWMLGHFGNGTEAACSHCGMVVTFDTMEVDRRRIGGSYRRDNVQPSCQRCNRSRADNKRWVGSNPQRKPSRPFYGAGSYGHNGIKRATKQGAVA